MKKEQGITIVLLLILWQVGAMKLANDILLPMPLDVLSRMLHDIQSFSFYQTLFLTLQRMLIGLACSFVSAMVLALMAGSSKRFRAFIQPLIVLGQTIPNISYIIFLLILVGSEGSVTIISFLVLFPLFYANILLAQDMLDSDLKDVLRLYPDTLFKMIFKVKIPMLWPYLFSCFRTAFGLGLRVCVMSELLGQVRIGIGRQMSLARLNLDTTSLFAWTIWIILISAIADILFSRLQRWIEKRY